MRFLLLCMFYVVMGLLCWDRYGDLKRVDGEEAHLILTELSSDASFWLGSDVEDDYAAAVDQLHEYDRRMNARLNAMSDAWDRSFGKWGQRESHYNTFAGAHGLPLDSTAARARDGSGQGQADPGEKDSVKKEKRKWGPFYQPAQVRSSIIDARFFLPLKTHWFVMLAVFVFACIMAYCIKSQRVREHVNPLNVKLVSTFFTLILPPVIAVMVLSPSAGVPLVGIFLLLHVWIIFLAYSIVYTVLGWSR